MTGGLNGRRLNCENPIAGLRAWGTFAKVVRGMLSFARTMLVHI